MEGISIFTKKDSLNKKELFIHVYNGFDLEKFQKELLRFKSYKTCTFSFTSRPINSNTLFENVFKILNLNILKIKAEYYQLGIHIPNSIRILENLRTLKIVTNKNITLSKELVSLKNLETLDLNINGLSEIPQLIFSLAGLKELRIGHRRRYSNVENNFEVPKEISKLQNLIVLDLSGNNLKKLPESITELKKLEALYIANNQLENLPENIFLFDNLKKLNCNNNKLIHLPIKIGALQNLSVLEIESNPLKELPISISKLKIKKLKIFKASAIKIPNDIGNFQLLEELEIIESEIENLPLSIGNIKKLKKLNLENNLLTNLPNTLLNLNKLEELNISNNNYFNIPIEIFSLIKLKKLNLEKNKLAILPDMFSKLINLEKLNLKNNNLTELPSSIGELAKLRELLITSNSLKSLPVSLVKLINLEKLPCGHNPLEFPPYDIAMRGVNITIQFLREHIKQNQEKIFLKINEDLEDFRTGLHQYLLYFRDFLQNVKDMKVDFSIRAFKNGFELEFQTKNNNDLKKIGRYLKEYVEYIKENTDGFIPHFEKEKLNNNAQAFATIELRSQIRHLQTMVELSNGRIQSLEEQNTSLKKQIISYEGIVKHLAVAIQGNKPTTITLTNKNYILNKNENNTTDLEGINQILDKIVEIEKLSLDFEEKLSAIYGQLNRIVVSNEDYYHDLIKSWNPNWEKLENNSLKYLISSEFLFDMLSKTNNNDYAPFIIQYCRAIENELSQKIFYAYHSDLHANYDIIGLTHFLTWDLTNNKEMAKSFKKSSPIFMLGFMIKILNKLIDVSLVSNSPIVNNMIDFLNNYFDNSMTLEPSFISDIESIKNDFRNPAAHPDNTYILGRNDAIICRRLARQIIKKWCDAIKS